MLYAYVAAAIVGLILLGASVLGGAGHEHSSAHDAAETASPALALLSVRVWTYFLAFGGATGALLRLTAGAGEVASAVGAFGVGAVAASMARVVIARASRAGQAGTVRAADLVGKTADVVVPFSGGATGKIRVRVAGADVDVLATTYDGEPMGRRDQVLIVEVNEGGSARVTRSPGSE